MEEQEVELLESWVGLGKAELGGTWQGRARWGGREEAKPRPGGGNESPAILTLTV